MKDLLNKTDREISNYSAKKKHLFRSVYCASCKQTKPCGKLDRGFCCPCQFQTEQAKAQEYSNYQQVYQSKLRERQAKNKQLQLLKDYSGCKQCGSLAVDAYSLYESSQLVCQPCLMRKEGGASGSINFLEQQKWYKRWWKVDIGWWLDKYQCLPVNKNCADKWRVDKQHLPNTCDCLEQETRKIFELFANSLKNSKARLKECQCETSPKWRVDYIDSEGSGWIYCEACETRIESAGHHGVIKNRNDPRFWGLEVKERVLCGDCLEKRKGTMKPLRRAKFNEYRKLRML